jgi:hypothetical protein
MLCIEEMHTHMNTLRVNHSYVSSLKSAYLESNTVAGECYVYSPCDTRHRNECFKLAANDLLTAADMQVICMHLQQCGQICAFDMQFN